jgi:CTP synthase (UTP-ammonia lyase)
LEILQLTEVRMSYSGHLVRLVPTTTDHGVRYLVNQQSITHTEQAEHRLSQLSLQGECFDLAQANQSLQKDIIATHPDFLKRQATPHPVFQLGPLQVQIHSTRAIMVGVMRVEGIKIKVEK